MKPLLQFGLCCMLAPGVFAAQHGGGGGSHGGSHGGGGTAGHNAGHIRGSVRTFGYGRFGGYGRGLYGYGGLWGDYGPLNDSGYYPPAEPNGYDTSAYPAMPAVVAPPVTAHPVIHEYAQPAETGNPAEQESGPVLYVIAFRDNTTHEAMTFWIDGGAIHYLDKDHQENQAPLASVDRNLSVKLNRERHVPFNLP